MNLKIRPSILAASALALITAAPASAAVDRTVTITPAKATVTWNGSTATSLSGSLGWFDSSDPAGSCHTFPGTGPAPSTDLVDYCDETLVKLDGTDPGTLDFQLPTAGDGNVTDWDLYVYTADADGNPGDLIGSSENAGGAEDVPLDDSTESDDYLVVAVPYQSVNDTFSGAVSYTPTPPAPADAG